MMAINEASGARVPCDQPPHPDDAAAVQQLRDDIAQRLAMLAVELGDIKTRVVASPFDAEHRLTGAVGQVVGLAQSIEALFLALDPSIVLHLGLHEALRRETALFEEREGIPVRYDGNAVHEEIDDRTASALFQVAQEALRQLTHRGLATCVDVRLVAEANRLRLCLHSDAGYTNHDAFSAGVDRMKERMARVGGQLTMTARQDRGTTLEASVILGGSRMSDPAQGTVQAITN